MASESNSELPEKSEHETGEDSLREISGLHKMPAPPDFTDKVTNTINKRSGGRFFGRRAFGDRVPFEVLALIIVGIAVALYLILSTGDAPKEPSSPERGLELPQ